MDTPPCGMTDCNEPAAHVDYSGVGYCEPHAHDGCRPVDAEHSFDPWWAAATIAKANGDDRFDDLDYGVWPS